MKNDNIQDRYIWLTEDEEHIAFRDEGTDPRLLEGLTVLTVELKD